MSSQEIFSRLGELLTEAHKSGLVEEKKFIEIALMSMLYAKPIQRAILTEITPIISKWAKRQRDAIDAKDAEDELEWFREFEWPDDLS